MFISAAEFPVPVVTAAIPPPISVTITSRNGRRKIATRIAPGSSQFCARCHSDPATMHEFNPALPTDQLAKFKDSPHGHRLARSSRRSRPVMRELPRRPRHSAGERSAVESLRAARSGNLRRLSREFRRPWPAFTRADGSPLPTTQLAEYRTSVHGKALLAARRSRRAALQRLPRQSRRHPAGRRERESQLQPLPFGQRQSVRRQQTQTGLRSTWLGRVQQMPRQSRHHAD